jgi:hypothetical protein
MHAATDHRQCKLDDRVPLSRRGDYDANPWRCSIKDDVKPE